jgi:hypothetical protein
LRDLFDLDARNGGRNKDSDRGAALGRLDAKTLGNLRDSLQERRDEALDKQFCDEYQYKDLRATVGLMAIFTALPPDKPLMSEKQDAPTPPDTVIHTSRGYVVNIEALKNAIPFDATAHYASSSRDENLNNTHPGSYFGRGSPAKASSCLRPGAGRHRRRGAWGAALEAEAMA